MNAGWVGFAHGALSTPFESHSDAEECFRARAGLPVLFESLIHEAMPWNGMPSREVQSCQGSLYATFAFLSSAAPLRGKPPKSLGGELGQVCLGDKANNSLFACAKVMTIFVICKYLEIILQIY